MAVGKLLTNGKHKFTIRIDNCYYVGIGVASQHIQRVSDDKKVDFEGESLLVTLSIKGIIINNYVNSIALEGVVCIIILVIIMVVTLLSILIKHFKLVTLSMLLLVTPITRNISILISFFF